MHVINVCLGPRRNWEPEQQLCHADGQGTAHILDHFPVSGTGNARLVTEPSVVSSSRFIRHTVFQQPQSGGSPFLISPREKPRHRTEQAGGMEPRQEHWLQATQGVRLGPTTLATGGRRQGLEVACSGKNCPCPLSPDGHSSRNTGIIGERPSSWKFQNIGKEPPWRWHRQVS